MKYIVNIYQRGMDLVFYRGIVNGEPTPFRRVFGHLEVTMTSRGDYIDVIYFDADQDYAVDKLDKGHYSYDDAAGQNPGKEVIYD